MGIKTLFFGGIVVLYVAFKIYARLSWNSNKLLSKRHDCRAGWQKLKGELDDAETLLKIICRAYGFDEDLCYKISPRDNLQQLYVMSGRFKEPEEIVESVTGSVKEAFGYDWPMDKDEDEVDYAITFEEIYREIVRLKSS